ncbi:hypothetical protein QBC40DRAFT_303318 [Triangularia verruculosa]|uniref:Uncharacterized protein n=1 Tax=Triangularia verruculosa TaxID=2587418 RepID=A0AAN7AZI7_9PEZI|nr:hypothetical protein QBC40DRAFT_303318 [Triangularia verruculosa]
MTDRPSLRIPMAGGRALPGNSMPGRRRAVTPRFPARETDLPIRLRSVAAGLQTLAMAEPLVIAPDDEEDTIVAENQDFTIDAEAAENQEFDFSLDAGILPPTPRFDISESPAVPSSPRSERPPQDPELLGIPSRPATAFSRRLNEPRARSANIYLAAPDRDSKSKFEQESTTESPNPPAKMNAPPRDEHLEVLASLNRATELAAQSALLQRSRSYIFGPPEEIFESASAQAGRMYGQAYIDHGAVQYAPTRRLVDWLEGITLPERAFESRGVAFPEVNSSMGGQAGSSNLATLKEEDEDDCEESTIVRPPTSGTKRQRDDDLESAPSKRSRLIMPIKRAVSRLSIGTKSRLPLADLGTVNSRGGEAMSRPDESGRGTPFSVMSQAFARASAIKTRNLKICVLGHAGAGKTTLINRLLMEAYIPGTPSDVTDFRTINTMASGDSLNKAVAQVELWDFPSLLAGKRHTHLNSTFFNAAIICYDIQDKQNLATISTFPNLGLRFLSAPEPATGEQGHSAALAIGAVGFGELSAKTGENCRDTWQTIVDYLVANEEKKERTMTQTQASLKGSGKVLGKMKETWHSLTDRITKEKKENQELKKDGN